MSTVILVDLGALTDGQVTGIATLRSRSEQVTSDVGAPITIEPPDADGTLSSFPGYADFLAQVGPKDGS